MAAEPLFHWHDIAHELIDFVALFLALGAVGFRWVVLSGVRAQRGVLPADDALFARMMRPAAVVGALGAAILVFHAWLQVSSLQEALRTMSPDQPAYARTSRAMPMAIVIASSYGAAALGFVLAALGARAAWILAGVAMVVGALRAGAFGQWSRLLKPAHEFAAGLWIGTLFVVIAVGVLIAWRAAAPDRRGPVVAGLVNAFSPFALTLGAAVATFGLFLALRELPSFAALWTTPYGRALCVKLALAAGVFGLGAWNGFRMRPRLGSADAVPAIRRSATAELLIAFAVLVATAILVTMPSPRP